MTMRILIVVLALAAAGAFFLTAHAEEPAAPQAPKITVGVFDSRAVVIAYAQSEMFNEKTKSARAMYRAARENGDEAVVEKIEAEMQAVQKKFHHQAFAATPVDDILILIEDQIPGIAEKAGVDLLVSKWQIVHQTDGAEVVDVTLDLIEPFKPSEKALKSIRELAGKMPVPVEDLEGHDE